MIGRWVRWRHHSESGAPTRAVEGPIVGVEFDRTARKFLLLIQTEAAGGEVLLETTYHDDVVMLPTPEDQSYIELLEAHTQIDYLGRYMIENFGAPDNTDTPVSDRAVSLLAELRQELLDVGAERDRLAIEREQLLAKLSKKKKGAKPEKSDDNPEDKEVE